MDSVELLRASADGKVVISPQVKMFIADELQRLRSALNQIVDETMSDENATQDELAYICQYTARQALRFGLRGPN